MSQREPSDSPPQPVGGEREPVRLRTVEPLDPATPSLPLLTAAEPAEAESRASAEPASAAERVANLGVPLGTLIFRAGLLTEEQLEEALQEGVRTGKRLGEVLIESGLLSQRDLGRLIAEQKGLRFVELSGITPEPRATALLTAEKAHMFAALPVGFEDGLPVIAVADPSNELVTENLRRALGSEPRLVVASRSELYETIDRLYGAVEEAPARPRLDVAQQTGAPGMSAPPEAADWTAASYDVSLRLTDGERVPVGSFGGAEEAQESARRVAEQLSDAGGEWPFFSGRFLRPDTIVSVDIEPTERPADWAGSSHRANWSSRPAS